ncbi:MAG: S-layer homology domain-containing protein [Deltaproteobacteria bacterium]|nr:MAG: S-layer homology domain-containing protein [Deltaproteobacteria bacterium]
MHTALTALVVLASFGVSLVLVASGASGAAPAGPTVLHVTPGGTGTSCAAHDPCGDFAAAARIAPAGAVVEVAPGSYGLQEIDVSRPGGGPNVVFRPAVAGSVRVAGIRSHTPGLTFQGFAVDGVVYFHPGADANVAVGNTIAQAFVTGADGTAWYANVIRPTSAGPDAMQIKGLDGDDPIGVSVVGNRIGPAFRSGSSHTDCIQILGGDDIVIERNVFLPCGDKALQIRSGAGGRVGSVTVTTNFIGECRPRRDACNGYHAAVVAAEGNTISFVHNTVNGSIALSAASVPGGERRVAFVGNIADSLPCTPASDYNLVRSGLCGPHDRLGAASFVDPREQVQDLRLRPGSAGLGMHSPFAPAIDIDGEYGCGSGDAGADQVCAVSPAEVAAISWLRAAGLTTLGPPVALFGPRATMTRAQAVTFLHRAVGTPAVSGPRLSDVPAGAYYDRAVRWGTAGGVITGYPDGTFRGSSPVTRGEFAVMLWRLAGRPASGRALPVDVTDGRFYSAAVRWAAEKGVMRGYGDGTFRPELPIERAHAALMLCRFSRIVPLPVGSCPT